VHQVRALHLQTTASHHVFLDTHIVGMFGLDLGRGLDLSQTETCAVPLQDIHPNEHAAVFECGFKNRRDFVVAYEFAGGPDGLGQMHVVGGDEHASGEHLSRQRAHLRTLLLPAIVHAFGKLGAAHLQVLALGALQARHEFRLADLAGRIHRNRSV